ncbi:transcriptional regulator, partial [Thioclava sp. BHET1]
MDLTFPVSTTHDCGSCPIRQRAVCARCDVLELQELETIKYYRSFEAGQT